MLGEPTYIVVAKVNGKLELNEEGVKSIFYQDHVKAKIKFSYSSALTSASEEYSKHMTLEVSSPLSNEDLNAVHERIKNKAMQHFHQKAHIVSYEDQLMKVIIQHLQFSLNYWFSLILVAVA